VRKTVSRCLTLAALVLALAPASGHAAAWLAPQNVATGGDYGHALAVAPDGEATVVYTAPGWPAPANAIQVWATPIGSDGTLGTPQALSPAGDWPGHPRAGVAPDGTVTAIWTHAMPGPGLHVRRIAPDGTLGPVSALSAPGADAWSHDVAMAPDGSATVTWVEGATCCLWGSAKAVRIAADGTVGPTIALSPPGTEVDNVRLAVAPDATTTAVWNTYTPETLEMVRIAADGTPGPVVGLASGIRPTDSPFLAVGPDGTATVAWQADSPAARNAVKALQISPTGVPGAVHTLAASGAGYTAAPVAVAPDGTATVAWTHLPAVSGDPLTIESVRIAPSGVPGPVRTINPSPTSAWHPNVATGPRGAAIVTWQDRTDHAVFASVIEPNGTIGPDEPIIHELGWVSSQAVVDFDAAGNAIALGLSERGGDNRFDVAYRDVQPPQFIKLSVPSRGRVGVAASFSAEAVDNRSGVASIRWDFGDGNTATGAKVKHAYKRAGTFLVRVTATDGAGNSASKTNVTVVT
jgi:hypothetical protein